MVQCIIIEKLGNISSKKMKNEEKKYALCNYKNSNDFKLLHIYKNIDNYKNKEFEIYGKEKGRANSENKYEFARPIDEKLFFGNLLVLMKNSETESYEDLSKLVWECVNEKLHGGFEDISGMTINKNGELIDQEERSVDSEVYDDSEYTQEGYLKDSFIVEDDELIEEDYVYGSDESYESDGAYSDESSDE